MASDTYDHDPQDQSEVFDEDMTDDVDSGPHQHEMKTFEEMPDVLDVTRRVGDGLDADRPLDEAEFSEDDLEDEDMEDEYVVGGESLNASSDDYGVESPEIDDEAPLESVEDIENRRGAQASAAHFESRGELSEEDLVDLGYRDNTDEE